MGSIDLYFHHQHNTHKIPRRYRKVPEELPESLRFAHLNPKVAALLASKERSSKQDNEDPFAADNLGKKSLLPDINSAFQNVKNQFDTNLLNDEDSQRFLFEEAKLSSTTVLLQLSRIIYYYEDLYKHIPKSLEYQIMSGYNEFTADVAVVPREWQTQEMKEQYQQTLQRETLSEEDISDVETQVSSQPKSRLDRSFSDHGSKLNFKIGKPRLGVINASPDEEGLRKSESRMGRRSESRMSNAMSQSRMNLDINQSRLGGRRRTGSRFSFYCYSVLSAQTPNGIRGRGDPFTIIDETPSDQRSTGMANPNSYMQTINFQLSNKSFEDKGWVMLAGEQDKVNQGAILEYCVKALQDKMKETIAQKQKDLEQGYDKEISVRYYGDTRKETLLRLRRSPVKSAAVSVQKGGKPRIPSITDERNEGKKLMQASHMDGTTIIYYPSGRPAVVYSAAGFGRPGFYTLVYDDDIDAKLLVCFTPCGKGVCYHENGVVRFLSTEKGGHVMKSDGALERKWKWPHSHIKLTEPISFQINSHIVFRCVGQGQMTLAFCCQKEVARFSVSPHPDAEEFKQDENDQLLTAFTFSSRAAKDLMRIFAPKKARRAKRKPASKSQSSEIVKLLQDFPDKVAYDLESDKELARLQRKARNLVDDWMEHYRIAVGFRSPHLQQLSEGSRPSICTSRAKSARVSDHSLTVRRAVLGIDDIGTMQHQRSPSAPLGRGEADDVDEEIETAGNTRRDTTTVTFEEPGQAGGDGTMSPSALAVMHRLTDNVSRRSARSKTSSARSISPSRQVRTPQSDRVLSASSGRQYCPVATRQQKLCYEHVQCRCSRHHIPFIMDLELDDFLSFECPDSQLIVIMVISSLFPGITKAEEMVNVIYENQNKNRTRPCVQSRTDIFRVFKYDINTAAEMSDHTQPLLLTQHNVVPGMFLIFCDGKLLFCDHIFNGYGNAKKDFKKQLMKSRHDSLHGFCLPADFRFSPGQGRSGMRSAWGGEIGGAGVDKYSSTGTAVDATLIPIHRSQSSSSSGNSRELQQVDANGCVDTILAHNEIMLRLKPLMRLHISRNSKSSRRPYLPNLRHSQVRSHEDHHLESVDKWVTTSHHNTDAINSTNACPTGLI